MFFPRRTIRDTAPEHTLLCKLNSVGNARLSLTVGGTVLYLFNKQRNCLERLHDHVRSLYIASVF